MIIDYSLSYGKPLIHLWYRKDKQKIHRIIDNFKPYFYVEKKAFDKKLLNNNCSLEEGYKSLYGDELIKIICTNPKDVGTLRQNFNCSYEADILFSNRYLIDNKVDFGDIPKIMYWDIEVLHEKGKFPEPNEAKYPLVSITFTSNYTDNYVTLFFDEKIIDKDVKNNIWIDRVNKKECKWTIKTFSKEKDMLLDFLNYVKIGDPDIFTGWNTDFFDMPYLINRMKNLGINYHELSPLNYVNIQPPRRNNRTGLLEQAVPKISGRNMFDLLIPYKKMNIGELKSRRLDAIGEKELGVKKVHYSGDLIDLYNKDKKLFCEYNLGDVELVKHIDNKVGIIKYFFELAKFIGCSIGDTMSNSRMGDIFTLKYCKEKGICLPSKKFTEAETFQGAIVIDPKLGMFDNVIVLDLKRIYPSCIISSNMSPETVDKDNGEIKLGNGMAFTNKRIGFSPEVLRRLFKVRDEKAKIKKQFEVKTIEWEKAKREEQFVKDLVNSFYGLLSYAGYRLYSPDIGASVTYMGRQVITHCKKIIEKSGHEILYGDTDSIFFLSNTNDAVQEGREVAKLINDSFDDFALTFGIKDHVFAIEFEKVYRKIIFIKKKGDLSAAKKRYIGKLCFYDGQVTDKLDYRGIESRRSDSSEITQDMMLKVFDMVLSQTKKDVVDKYIEQKINDFKKMSLDSVGIPKGIQKDVSDYYGENKNGDKKSPSAHIRGLEYSNKFFKTTMGKGSKPKYLYVKRKISERYKYPFTDVITFEEQIDIPEGFWNEYDVNYDMMIDKLIIDKLRPIYDVLKWSFRGEGVQKSLESY